MIALDIETTGVNLGLHDMCSLGAVEIETGKEFYEECGLSGREVLHASKKALEINGFTEEQLLDPEKNRPYVVLQNFMEWAQELGHEKVLVGINLPSFDVQFLRKYYNMIGYQGPEWLFGHRYVDLHSMSFLMTQLSLRTSEMCEFFQVEQEPEIHNALEGAKMNSRLYKRMNDLLNDHKAKDVGTSIVCNSGTRMDFANPDPSMVNLPDIAHGLSQIPRFAGQGGFIVIHPYSVAMHSVNCAWAVETLGGTREEILAALLHDASEAYLGDLAAPAKNVINGYQRVEKRLAKAIGENFGIDLVSLPEVVKFADEQLLFWEAKQLYPESLVGWTGDVVLDFLKGKKIESLSAPGAKVLFQDVFFEITKVKS